MTIIEWKLLQWLAKPWSNGPGLPEYLHSFTVNGNRVYFSNVRDSFVKDAERAALRLKKNDWFDIDPFGNHRLNTDGMHAARTIPRPSWNPPKPPALTDQDYEVLAELGAVKTPWATPLDCGGRNGSHHSHSLTKLTLNGLAECSQRGRNKPMPVIQEPSIVKRPKGSRVFRITAAGQKKLTDSRQMRS